MSSMADLIRRLRRQLGDDPLTSRTASGDPVPDEAGNTDITVPDGHTSRFQIGEKFEFDDNSLERLEVNTIDSENNIVNALRAREGTDHAAHVNGTAIVISPRNSAPMLSDLITEIIDDELWPDVWIFGESTLDYHANSDFYVPSVSDVERVVYAYQIVSGYRYSLGFNYLGSELVTEANGAITIPDVADYSTIYYAYRLRPTIDNLTNRLERGVLLGATAEVISLEEGTHVGPDRTAVDATVGDGAALRAGLVRWQRFLDWRTRENTRLIQLEQEKMPAAGAMLQ